jgi:GTPase
VEYKYHLIAPCESRLQHLITQLKWRLQEGQGEALYEIGVSDDGTCRGLSESDLAASLETLNAMAAALSATATVIRRLQGKEGFIAEVLVRQACSDGDFIDVRIAVVGNVDR